MAEINGPNLDQLDAWGDLDSLPYSLDSSVWDTADLWEGSGSAAVAITATGTVSVQRHATGSAATAVTETSSVERIVHFTGTASGALSITASADVPTHSIVATTANIVVTSSASASKVFDVSSSVSIAIDFTLSIPNATFLFGGSGAVAITQTSSQSLIEHFEAVSAPISINLSLSAEKLGESWSVVAAESETWSSSV